MNLRNNATTADKARAYFHRPGFKRLLSAVWKRMEGLGRVGGNAIVPGADEAECEAYNSFFGTNEKPGSTLKISLSEFERELLASAFPFTLPELFEVLEGRPFLTQAEKQTMRSEAWRHLFERVRVAEAPLSGAVDKWISGLEEASAAGYRTLRELFGESHQQAYAILKQVTRAVNWLLSRRSGFSVAGISLDSVRLPVLAAMVTGDSHAFDAERVEGRLLRHALRELSGAPINVAHGSMSESSLDIRKLYRKFGIADDDLSSIVYVFQPTSTERDRRYDQHYELEVLTLRQVESMRMASAPRTVYIVENPPVFSTLMDVTSASSRMSGGSIANDAPVLFCTSGAISAAALRWLQKCMEASGRRCDVYYSGDFDVKGLEIACGLSRRLNGRWHPWRYDIQTYEQFAEHLPGPIFDEHESRRLLSMNVPWSPTLTGKMAEKGCRLFQESFVEALAQDWLTAVASAIHR